MSRAPLFVEAEQRFDRPHGGQQTPSHVQHPNGSVMDTFDAALCGVLARAVLEMWAAA